ncbi:MFS transporter (plasmid) [Streptomyces sp. NBC_00445]|uniref:MFS transporter n=1 Tax=Streptomyces sp. NBC_00445 TaxID=2975745 RepID=UPI002E1C518B
MTASRATTLRLLSAHALSSTATTIPVPLLTAELYSATQSAAALGVLGACRMLPYIVLGPWAGRLADRTNCRTLLQSSFVLRALLVAALAAATATHSPVALLIILSVAASTAGTPAFAACGAVLPDLSGQPRQLTQATQTLVYVEAGAWVAGPALGGVLLAIGPPVAGPLAAVGLLCAAIGLIRGLRLPRPRSQQGRGPRGSWQLLARAPRVVAVVVAVNLAVDATAAVLRLLAESDRAYGLLAAGLGGGVGLCFVVARWFRDVALVAATVVAGGSVLAAAIVAWTPGRALLLLVAGAAAASLEARATVQVQCAVPSARRGEALGVLDQAIVAGALVGTVLGPVAAATWTAPAVVAAAGGLLLAVALASGVRHPRGRTGDHGAAQPVGPPPW